MEMKHNETIIIGAGLTGCTLGNLLTLKNQKPLILEKSRGVGGRLATRRIDGLGLDHGAPFLGLMPQISGGMNAYAKTLAVNLNILKEQKVDKILNASGFWKLLSDSGVEFNCQNLILTAPLPQAAELLGANKLVSLSHPIFKVRYSKAIVILITVREIPTDFQSGTFDKNFYYLMKERGLHPQGIVIHLSEALSDKYFDEPEEATAKILKTSPLSELHIEKFELKKWRYSKVINAYPDAYLQLQPNLYLCGDGFGDPLLSARAVANQF